MKNLIKSILKVLVKTLRNVLISVFKRFLYKNFHKSLKLIVELAMDLDYLINRIIVLIHLLFAKYANKKKSNKKFILEIIKINIKSMCY